MAVKKETSYLDFLNEDLKKAEEQVNEHKAKTEFHQQQLDYWKLQVDALRTVKTRIWLNDSII